MIVFAFSMVSAVLKDLDTINTLVLFAWARSKIWLSSALSILAAKWTRILRFVLFVEWAKAWTARRGPKSEPPIPIWIKSVTPTHLLHRPSIRCHTSAIAGMTSCPRWSTGLLSRLRRAVCKAGRCSDVLTRPPVNKSLICPCRPIWSAFANKRPHSFWSIPW